MQFTNYVVLQPLWPIMAHLQPSSRPIMGFITETPLETVSFSTINLLKYINLFAVQFFRFFYSKIRCCFYYMKKKRGQLKYWQLSQNSWVFFFQIVTIFYLIYPFSGWEFLTVIWVHLGFVGFGVFFCVKRAASVWGKISWQEPRLNYFLHNATANFLLKPP